MLADDRPGDLRLAWDDLEARGRRWVRAAREGFRRLPAPRRTLLDAAVRILPGLA